MKQTNLLFLIALAGLLSLSSSIDTAASKHPNVIVVMADDLGIGDVSPTNPECKIKTPNLQSMADEGLVFSDAHTPSSVCTPTRYGLLTGRYNWRSRLARGVLSGTSKHLIPADRPTLGHLMRKAGYHTSMIGKWHLGWDWNKPDGKNIDFTKPVLNGPDINGFDQYYAHCGSLDMPPYVWVDTGRVTAQPDRTEGVTKKEDRYGWYRKGPIGSDFHIEKVLPHLFEKTISRVNERASDAKSGKPFFIYLALPAPHTPIVPVPPFKDASGLNPYADFVMQTDHHMGELMAAVKKAGLDDNTLVVFTSDNGCSPEANFQLLKEHGHNPSAIYRGHKADIYEGGHRVPFIARWPGKIKGGRTTKALACLTDIYTTLEAITEQKRQDIGGEDGFSLLPVFEGADSSGRSALISHSIGGSFAIRKGPWKLCLSAGSGGWSAPRENEAKKQGLPAIQLFNLNNDPAETNNIADSRPKHVKSLIRLLELQVKHGRSTKGESLSNDREITFLPEGVKLPAGS
jgi:arylsulfatase A